MKSHILETCDVIWENLAYEGANSTSLDQCFPYVYTYIVFKVCRNSEFFLMQMLIYKTKKYLLYSDAAQYARRLVRA